jgi:threonine dehydrogenase-like Zn-dependent dehydrogenase
VTGAPLVGADAAFDPADDVPNLIRDATGGRKLDLALDCIGRTAAVRQALFSLARGGRVVLVGQSFESLDAGPILVLSVLRISLLGHLGYGKRDLEDVLALIASGRLDLSASISDRLPLDRINEGIDRLRRKDEATVRLILLPQT